MNEEIVIYKSGDSANSFNLYSPEKKSFNKLKLGFVIFPLIGLIFISLPFVVGELNYLSNKNKEKVEIESKFRYVLSPKDHEFELIISKIGVRTQVLTNVSAANEEQYNEVLKDKAAHAIGSSLPDEAGATYIFGHSTNSIFNLNFFNPVFYSLKKLDKGDNIALVYKGKVYSFQVEGQKIINPDEVSEIENLNLNEKKLILQTCWPPGTAWKRLLVIAYPIT